MDFLPKGWWSGGYTTCQPLLSICGNDFLKIKAMAMGQKPLPLINIPENQQSSLALRSSPTDPF